MRIFNNLSPIDGFIGCQSYHEIKRLQILCVNNLSRFTSNWIEKSKTTNSESRSCFRTVCLSHFCMGKISNYLTTAGGKPPALDTL